MSKKKELWLAFAGDELTCTVTVNEGKGTNGFVEISLAGGLTPERLYIYDLIMDVVENSVYDTAFLNVKNLVFFSGHTINDCAIEQLLKFVYYFTKSHKKLNVQLEDGCVKDVLKSDLAGNKFGLVNISDATPAALARGRGGECASYL